jgi:hypothetical protein
VAAPEGNAVLRRAPLLNTPNAFRSLPPDEGDVSDGDGKLAEKKVKNPNKNIPGINDSSDGYETKDVPENHRTS